RAGHGGRFPLDERPVGPGRCRAVPRIPGRADGVARRPGRARGAARRRPRGSRAAGRREGRPVSVRRAGTGVPPLVGTASVPSDKSISHRAAILAAMADGTSRIRGYSPAGDCRSTLRVISTLGATVTERDGELTVRGSPLLHPGVEAGSVDAVDLDCGRSGTTMRLAAGAVAGAPMRARLTGDPQLLGRPMERVAEPLRLMGAAVETTGGRPPVILRGGGLRGIRYR